MPILTYMYMRKVNFPPIAIAIMVAVLIASACILAVGIYELYKMRK